MSQLTKIMDNMVPSTTVELEPYRFHVNGEALDYNSHTSTCEIDTDGDLMLDFVVDKGDLLDIVDDESIVTYLENNGYVVTEE